MTDDLPSDLAPIPFVRPEPTAAFFGKGRKAEHPSAVMYVGEFETLWDGTAVAVRAHARALAQTGIPVLLRSFSGTVVDENGICRPAHSVEPHPQVASEIGPLELTTADSYFPVIKHLVVRDAEHLRQVVIPRGAIAEDFEQQAAMRKAIYDSTILYTVWERDRVDPGIVKILSKVAENWVPCRANRNMLISCGVPAEKIVVVPHPYDPADPILKLRRRKPDTEWKKFYSIGRWEPRKGYAELVDAFLLTFKPSDKAILTIKYTGGKWPGYPSPEETMTLAIVSPVFRERGWTPEKIRERVKLIEGRFPRAAILELHYRNNLYVSASRGEAWNLPAFEAALAGNSVCYVPSGGVEDYLGNGHSVVAPDGLEAVPRSYNWEADAQWMSYSIRALGGALERSFIPLTHERLDSIALAHFTLEAIGKRMRDRVLEVATKRSAAALYYVEQCKKREAQRESP